MVFLANMEFHLKVTHIALRLFSVIGIDPLDVAFTSPTPNAHPSFFVFLTINTGWQRNGSVTISSWCLVVLVSILVSVGKKQLVLIGKATRLDFW